MQSPKHTHARAFTFALLALAITGAANAKTANPQAAPTPTSSPAPTKESKPMDLGNFSVSLTVKDIKASMDFYEKLGFKPVGGKLEQKWIVLQNGNARIGLFQGMFDKNILTFNPGWGPDKQPLKEFQDVRELQRTLKSRGIKFSLEANETTEGPAHFMISDPDGNTLLFDQHVASPKR